MTYSSIGRRDTFPGDGTANPRNTTFRVWASTDIVVWKYDAVATAYSLLAEGVDYTVALGSPLPATATLTPLAAIAVGDRWYAWRKLPRTQLVDFLAGGDFPSASHEQALDRLAMIADEIDELEERAVRIRIDDDTAGAVPDMVLPRKADRANKLLQFDGSGQPSAVDVDTIIPGTVTFSAIGQSIAEAADAAAVRALIAAVFNRSGVFDNADASAAAKPAPGVFGEGFFIGTGDRTLWYSNGAGWLQLGAVELTGAIAWDGTASRLQLNSTAGELAIGTGGGAKLVRSLPPGYKSGMQVTPASGGATASDQVVTVGTGARRNTLPAGSEDEVNIILTSAITKHMGGLWVAGTSQAGFGTGLSITADTWYHVFAIYNEANGAVDVILDTSVSCANGLSRSSYTHAVPIGSVYVGNDPGPGPLLLEYSQVSDNVIWTTDLSGQTDLGWSYTDGAISRDYTAGALCALTYVPPGVSVELLQASWVFETGTSSRMWVAAHPDQSGYTYGQRVMRGSTIANAKWPGHNLMELWEFDPRAGNGLAGVRTNNAQQIRLYSESGTHQNHFFVMSFRHPWAAPDANIL